MTQTLVILIRGQCTRLARAARQRGNESSRGSEAGISTLEMAVIALGILLMATALVAAIKTAVDSRTSQIK